MLHHVLFSFKNYHDCIMKVNVWAKMTDDIRELYIHIVKVNIRECEKVLELSWRYHATYIKVLDTIIDSQFEHNNRVIDSKKMDLETMNKI